MGFSDGEASFAGKSDRRNRNANQSKKWKRGVDGKREKKLDFFLLKKPMALLMMWDYFFQNWKAGMEFSKLQCHSSKKIYQMTQLVNLSIRSLMVHYILMPRI